MIVLIAVMVGLAVGERTVLVTPRPRWLRPTKFAYEPLGDPASPRIPPLLPLRRSPVISLRVIHDTPNSLRSSKLPVEHRQQQLPKVTLRPPSLLERPIVVMPAAATTPPILPTNHKPESHLEDVFVESLPSLSVNLDEISTNLEEPALLPDYLTPPKYPSEYAKHFIEVVPQNAVQPPKKIKKNKKRKQKLESGEKKGNRTRNRSGHPNSLQKFRPQSSGERVEFQLHGQNGPDSYKFGFDTGAGKNRQFRFEEKDANGNVKGHFGYYDTTGKLQIFNYRADETGFHAEQID